jgi:hypothetical protein
MGQANTTSDFSGINSSGSNTNKNLKGGANLQPDLNSMEMAIVKGEREKRLENMVIHSYEYIKHK